MIFNLKKPFIFISSILIIYLIYGYLSLSIFIEPGCIADAGSQTFEKIPVKGFMYGERETAPLVGELESLLEDRLDFIEFEITKYRAYGDIRFDDEGYYQFFVDSRDNPSCKKYEDALSDSHIFRKRYIDFLKTKCIAFEKVDKPKSRYTLIKKRTPLIFNNSKKGTVHAKTELVYKEINTPKVIAFRRDYSFAERCWWCFSSGRRGVSCGKLKRYNWKFNKLDPLIY